MTKKDLFIIIIKLFGFYTFVKFLFTTFLRDLSFLISNNKINYYTFALMSIPLFISLLLFIGLVFYADTVVQLLKLDRNFDDDRVEIGNLNLNNILILAVVIIGGFLILDNIAALASRSFYMFQKLQMGINISYFDKTSLVISAINVIIGYILITNYKSVAKILKIK